MTRRINDLSNLTDRHRKKILRCREWHKLHRDQVLARNKEWQANHIQDRRIYARRRYHIKYPELINEIHQLLGNKCSNPDCPIPKNKMDKRCLQIDHINNDGKTDRIKGMGMIYFYRILNEIKSGSKRYQLLCPYCNWRKRYAD